VCLRTALLCLRTGKGPSAWVIATPRRPNWLPFSPAVALPSAEAPHPNGYRRIGEGPPITFLELAPSHIALHPVAPLMSSERDEGQLRRRVTNKQVLYFLPPECG